MSLESATLEPIAYCGMSPSSYGKTKIHKQSGVEPAEGKIITSSFTLGMWPKT